MTRRSAALARVASLAIGASASDTVAAQPARAPAPGAVWIRVVDAEEEPVAGAELVLPTLGVSVRVPSGGALLLTDIPPGVYLVQARQVGYAPAWRALRVGRDTIAAQLALGPLGQSLDPVTVTATAPSAARLVDFERRRALGGFGHFVTREEIERRHPYDVATIMRWVPGIEVTTYPTSAPTISSRRAGQRRCAGMLVYLDGVLVSGRADLGGGTVLGETAPSSGRSASTPGMSAPVGTVNAAFDVTTIPTSLVAGMEVYPSLAGVPAEYQGNNGAQCGVILLWTAAR